MRTEESDPAETIFTRGCQLKGLNTFTPQSCFIKPHNRLSENVPETWQPMSIILTLRKLGQEDHKWPYSEVKTSL